MDMFYSNGRHQASGERTQQNRAAAEEAKVANIAALECSERAHFGAQTERNGDRIEVDCGCLVRSYSFR